MENNSNNNNNNNNATGEKAKEEQSRKWTLTSGITPSLSMKDWINSIFITSIGNQTTWREESDEME